MFVHPPVEDARCKVMRELFSWQAIVTTLPRIRHTRYQVRPGATSSSHLALFVDTSCSLA